MASQWQRGSGLTSLVSSVLHDSRIWRPKDDIAFLPKKQAEVMSFASKHERSSGIRKAEPTMTPIAARRARSPVAPGALLLPVILAFVPLVTRAELLYFKKGGSIHAPASFDGNRVVIDLPEGRHEFLRDEFRKLVPGFSPEREWDDRRRRTRSAGVPVRFAGVWWAIENGLISQAVEEIRQLHELDPRHDPTTRMAKTICDLERACPDPDTTAFRKALGVSTSIARGPHIVLLHQRTDAEAGERIALLERVLAGYYLVFAGQGIDLKVPESRLIFAWFDSQADYLAFLHTQNADAFASTRGYYHPTWNAVVAYDSRSSDRQRTGRESALARREELRQFQTTVERLQAGAKLRVTLTGEKPQVIGRAQAGTLLDRLEREVRREELLLELERREFDDATAAHELIHLLVANSRLLPRHDAFPVWLQEGLAMQFEVIRGGRWAGVGRANEFRLPDWRQLRPAPSLEPLVRDVGFGRGYRRDAYAQAWSLVYFLRSRHSAGFLTFLDLLRSRDSALDDLAPSDRWLAVFHRAFGSDLEALEGEWHQFMSDVKSPLERHAPDSELPSPPATPSSAAARHRARAPRSTD
jgi:hypothetical protein